MTQEYRPKRKKRQSNRVWLWPDDYGFAILYSGTVIVDCKSKMEITENLENEVDIFYDILCHVHDWSVDQIFVLNRRKKLKFSLFHREDYSRAILEWKKDSELKNIFRKKFKTIINYIKQKSKFDEERQLFTYSYNGMDELFASRNITEFQYLGFPYRDDKYPQLMNEYSRKLFERIPTDMVLVKMSLNDLKFVIDDCIEFDKIDLWIVIINNLINHPLFPKKKSKFDSLNHNVQSWGDIGCTLPGSIERAQKGKLTRRNFSKDLNDIEAHLLCKLCNKLKIYIPVYKNPKIRHFRPFFDPDPTAPEDWVQEFQNRRDPTPIYALYGDKANIFGSQGKPMIQGITELHLPYIGMEMIPIEIYKFKKLQVLDISNNKLRIFPVKLGSMNLEAIKMYFNDFQCSEYEEEILNLEKDIAQYLKQKWQHIYMDLEYYSKKLVNNDTWNRLDLINPNLEKFQPKLIEMCKLFENTASNKLREHLSHTYFRNILIDASEIDALKKFVSEIELEIGSEIPIYNGSDEFFYYEGIEKETKYIVIRNKYVSDIRLNNLGLTKIPESISAFNKIGWISLSNNSFEYWPDMLVDFKDLIWFDINNNNFHKLPRFLVKCPSLGEFYFLNNPLTEDWALKHSEIWDHEEILKYLQSQIEIEEWTFESLKIRIKNNSGSTVGDIIAPPFLFHSDKILKLCQSIHNETSQEVYELYHERLAITEIERIIGQKFQCYYYFHPSENGFGLEMLYDEEMIYSNHVGNISLKNLNLKEVPTPIFQLKRIRELYLSNNILFHLPIEILNLSKLRRFLLNNNHFKEFPIILAQMGFEEFSIENNPLDDISKHLKKNYGYIKFDEILNKYLEDWDIVKLMQKIAQNEKLNLIDKIHPDLRRCSEKILNECEKFQTETAKKIEEIYKKEFKVRLNSQYNIYL